MYATVIDDNADTDVDDGGRVCGSGGQAQLTHVYTSTLSTLKLVVHRVVQVDDDDDDASGYNFLLKYEGRSVNEHTTQC